MELNNEVVLITKTQATIDAYTAVGLRIEKQLALKKGKAVGDLSSKDLVAFANEELLPSVMSATRRYYLASIIEILQQRLDAKIFHGAKAKDLSEALNLCLTIQARDYNDAYEKTISESIVPIKRRTSNQKQKSVSLEELDMLLIQARMMNSYWAEMAIIFLMANLHVGLRVAEWENAFIMRCDGTLNLMVVNAKHTNGRGHGKYRHLGIRKLGPEVRELLELQILIVQVCKENNVSWQSYCSSMRHALHRLTRIVMPDNEKFISLSSARHQFSANAKSGGLSDVERAAILGHATDETCRKHYSWAIGSTLPGHFKVSALKSETSKIRAKAKLKGIAKVKSPRIIH